MYWDDEKEPSVECPVGDFFCSAYNEYAQLSSLAETARIMAARGLLQSDRMAVIDLALYPDPGAEKLFLQDLYAALHAPGEIVVFEHYESCHPLRARKMRSQQSASPSAPFSLEHCAAT